MQNLREDPFRDLENDIHSFMRLHDKDGNGKVSRSEYMDVCKASWVKRMAEFSHKEEYRNDIMGDLEKMFKAVTNGTNVMDTEMHYSMFPDCVLFPVVLETMDMDLDGKIYKEELVRALETLTDINFGKSTLIPLSILLTGTIDGLDYISEDPNANSMVPPPPPPQEAYQQQDEL